MGNPVWVTSLAKVKGTRSLEDLGQRSGPLEGVIPVWMHGRLLPLTAALVSMAVL